MTAEVAFGVLILPSRSWGLIEVKKRVPQQNSTVILHIYAADHPKKGGCFKLGTRPPFQDFELGTSILGTSNFQHFCGGQNKLGTNRAPPLKRNFEIGTGVFMSA